MCINCWSALLFLVGTVADDKQPTTALPPRWQGTWTG